MSLSRLDLGTELHPLEAKVRCWLNHREMFAETFETASGQLVAQARAEQHPYAWQRLAAIIQPSGLNP